MLISHNCIWHGISNLKQHPSMTIRNIGKILGQTIGDFSTYKITTLSAALAYYTIFALGSHTNYNPLAVRSFLRKAGY